MLDMHIVIRRTIFPLEHIRRMHQRLFAVLGVKEHVRYENIDDLGIDREVQLTIGTFEMQRHLVDDRDHIKEVRLFGIGRL